MKKRSSNMELLRVCAMLMIIAYHIFYHCTYIQLVGAAQYSKPFFIKDLHFLR